MDFEINVKNEMWCIYFISLYINKLTILTACICLTALAGSSLR